MKAILVIDDMPIKCEECPLHYRKRQEIYRCEMTHKNIRLNSKPSWCPLKPLPKKILTLVRMQNGNIVNVQETSFANGWNDCLEEITGETQWK